jgi:hypothetical protein
MEQHENEISCNRLNNVCEHGNETAKSGKLTN